MNADPSGVLHFATLIERAARDLRESAAVHAQLASELAAMPAGLIVPDGPTQNGAARFRETGKEKQAAAQQTGGQMIQNAVALLNLAPLFAGEVVPFLKAHGVNVTIKAGGDS